jgi:DNA-binding response OmpR family regulator
MTAIIFLTAFAGPEDRIKGLELGAEDYVAKPFHFKELLLRIQNGLRRARYLTSSTDTDVKIGAAVFHFSRFEVQVGDRIVPLTHKECALMRFLFERRGKTVSRDEILNEIWSENEFPTTRTVDNFIMRLRRLVESDPENPQTIRSIRGVGYQLEK